MKYTPDPKFTELGEAFAEAVETPAFPKKLIRFKNDRWAARVGLDSLEDDAWCNHFVDFNPLADNLKRPLAQKYHGHQFQNYNPNIGDGRGFLFAQMRDDAGRLLDLGTKGSGTTPFSRDGDGRLTLKGGVREVLATEMLEALGVDTSKSFSLIETGEPLQRGDEPSPTRSAVLVRLSHGHIRIGTFQHHSYFDNREHLIKLVDYCLEHYYGEVLEGDDESRVLHFISLVTERTARLAAETMVAGFVHGVLNTDNINITGESFDYGPWRFLDRFDPSHTAAYFDHSGLYAYGRQPSAIQWNLYQLAGSLSGIAGEEPLRERLAPYPDIFNVYLRELLMKKLGVAAKDPMSDDALLKALNDFMVAEDIPYEATFFDWYCGDMSSSRAKNSPHKALYQSESFLIFQGLLKTYSPRDASALDHAYFKRDVPCTMVIEEMEAIWTPIMDDDNWSLFEQKIEEIREMDDALNPKNIP